MTIQKPSRREFVKSLAIGTGAMLLPGVLSGCSTAGATGHDSSGGSATTDSTGASGWDMLPAIVARIRAPVFADRDFDVTRFGGVADGTTDCTDSFRAAIDACVKAGGGRVRVPPGRFLTGAIHLRSNVNLHVEKGATIAFSRDTSHYLPAVLTRFEGTELMNYSPFIYALDQVNIAITGEGTLDGQADREHWWSWKGTEAGGWKPGMPNYSVARRRLLDMAERGVPVSERTFGEGDYLRPQFIQPYHCSNVLIEGVTIINSPMWEIHPVLCSNVTVRRVTIDSHGPNNDGCDPESCRYVLIDECVFNTGDDCIAIKSGRNADGRRLHVPSEYIVVRGCHMVDGHGGVTVGSEISGNCRYVFAERCRMDSPRLDMAIRLKNNASRGGVLENIYVRNVTVGQVAQAVLSIDFNYEEGAKGGFTPVARNVELRNVRSSRSEYALYLRGFANAPISNVRVIDCTFDNVARGDMVEHVEGLTLDRVMINGKLVHARAADMTRMPMPGRLALGIALAAIAHGAGAQGAGAHSAQPGRTEAWSVRMADAIMQRHPVTTPKWDYAAGVVLLAIQRVGQRTGDPRYATYVRANMDRFVGPDGRIAGYRADDASLDQINQGRLLFALYRRTHEARYRVAAFALRDQLRHQPRTAEGGFWHKKIYPQQMWLDGLYMAEPFYAEFARTFGDSAAFRDIARQFLLVARHTRDPRTGLLYHAWDASHSQFWADPATGLSRNFWGRAVGWYLMATVDVLDYLPEGDPDRPALLRTFQRLAAATARVQDPVTGLWYQVLDQPSRAGNYLEASASSMFVYALAKGARMGYLKPRFRAIARAGFDGLTSRLVRVDSDGLISLTGICKVAGLGPASDRRRDGSFGYYVSEPVVVDDYKGTGPFILGALELGQ